MSVLGMSLRVSAIELLCLTNLLLRGLLENGSRRWCMIGESRNSRTWCGSFSGGEEPGVYEEQAVWIVKTIMWI